MLLIHADFRETLDSLGLDSATALRQHFRNQSVFRHVDGVLITHGPLGPVRAFFKEYNYDQPSWKFIGRASKARREYVNLQRLAAMGIPCAAPIACGERRDALGRLHSAFIVTQAVEQTLPLDRFYATSCADRHEAMHGRLRAALINELAPQVASMHKQGFVHNDLRWRNILVEREGEAGVRLHWIDCPRGRWRRGRPRKAKPILKDLATLDLAAITCCSVRERLRFLTRYCRALETRVKPGELAEAVARFRHWRWPHDPHSPIKDYRRMRKPRETRSVWS